MTIKAGIWIDHRQAVVVLVAETGKTIKKIASGIQRPDHLRTKHKYTKNDFAAEDRLQQKTMSQLDAFYKVVIACIREADAILVVGPGEAKGEFIKRLKSKKLRACIEGTETSDKMTDRQLAAKIEQHFAEISANKSAPLKTTAKRATKPSTGKRTKKLGRKFTRISPD